MLWNTNTASCWTRRQTTAAVNSPRSSSHRSVLKTESDHRNLLLTLIVRCVYNTRGVTDAKVEQEAGQLLFAVAVFLLHLLSKLRFVWVRSAQVYKRVVLIQTRRFKARYTLATKLNSTRSTLLKVDKVDRVALAPYTLATKSTDHTGDKVDRVGDSVDRDKLSNSSCCRFVAKTGDKVDRISDSRLCRQCVPRA